MLEQLKEKVFKANYMLYKKGLVTLTWGNVSGRDTETGLIVIKPSGVAYEEMTSDDMIVLNLDGEKIEGNLSPSSDTPTHLELYKAYPEIGGITHTNSRYATVFAQAQKDIPALGTTHADTFYGSIPCTRKLTPKEINGEYEKETATVIIEAFKDKKPLEVPGVLVASHGVFTWGENAIKSVENAITLEEVAFIAYHTLALNPNALIQKELLDKHYQRKHGKNAYYGQKK